VVGDEGTHDTGRVLGAQGDKVIVLILEDVHLLRHHVRAFAEVAEKQACILENRRRNLKVRTREIESMIAPLDSHKATQLFESNRPCAHICRNLHHRDLSFLSMDGRPKWEKRMQGRKRTFSE
jgi:hypothetical protein